MKIEGKLNTKATGELVEEVAAELSVPDPSNYSKTVALLQGENEKKTEKDTKEEEDK
jgi:hypothetical protein